MVTIVLIRVEDGDVDEAVKAAEKAVVLMMPPPRANTSPAKPKPLAVETHWYHGA